MAAADAINMRPRPLTLDDAETERIEQSVNDVFAAEATPPAADQAPEPMEDVEPATQDDQPAPGASPGKSSRRRSKIGPTPSFASQDSAPSATPALAPSATSAPGSYVLSQVGDCRKNWAEAKFTVHNALHSLASAFDKEHVEWTRAAAELADAIKPLLEATGNPLPSIPAVAPAPPAPVVDPASFATAEEHDELVLAHNQSFQLLRELKSTLANLSTRLDSMHVSFNERVGDLERRVGSLEAAPSSSVDLARKRPRVETVVDLPGPPPAQPQLSALPALPAPAAHVPTLPAPTHGFTMPVSLPVVAPAHVPAVPVQALPVPSLPLPTTAAPYAALPPPLGTRPAGQGRTRASRQGGTASGQKSAAVTLGPCNWAADDETMVQQVTQFAAGWPEWPQLRDMRIQRHHSIPNCLHITFASLELAQIFHTNWMRIPNMQVQARLHTKN